MSTKKTQAKTTLVGILEVVRALKNGPTLEKALKLKRNRGVTRIHAKAIAGTPVHHALIVKFGKAHVTDVRELSKTEVFFKVM